MTGTVLKPCTQQAFADGSPWDTCRHHLLADSQYLTS